jgi:Spy/CpxP family protein refolding chaperone
MKRIAPLFLFLLISTWAFAQVQRVVPQRKAADSSFMSRSPEYNGPASMERRQMMNELNLTREQRVKMKEIRQSGMARQEAVSNDDKLTPVQKEDKLRELKREQARDMQSVLTDEQKAKLRNLQQQKRQLKNDQ